VLSILLAAVLVIAPQTLDLADIHAARVELQLVRENLANSTLALAHADHANEHAEFDLAALKSDIMADPLAADRRIDQIDAALAESLAAGTNSTLMALALDGVVRDSVGHYEAAVSDEGHDGQAEIVGVADYQSAQALAAKAREMFEELKPLAPASAKDDIKDVDSGLTLLENFMERKVDAHGVEDVMHEFVLSGLYHSFNIESTPEFGAPILAAVAVALAVIVARRRLAVF
jgi:uncharacterized protein (TIGR03382 family)